jgi:hypothetical protein
VFGYIHAMEREARKRRLERFSRNERIFPGGEHETGHCGACARIIAERFGGEVRGYWHEDNPVARVGEVEGGHDFAITPDRFLVDPWLFHYYAETPVLDLTEPAGQAEATARYGPEEKWERVPSRDRLSCRRRSPASGGHGRFRALGGVYTEQNLCAATSGILVLLPL